MKRSKQVQKWLEEVVRPEIKLNLLLLKTKDYAGRNQFLIKFAS